MAKASVIRGSGRRLARAAGQPRLQGGRAGGRTTARRRLWRRRGSRCALRRRPTSMRPAGDCWPGRTRGREAGSVRSGSTRGCSRAWSSSRRSRRSLTTLVRPTGAHASGLRLLDGALVLKWKRWRRVEQIRLAEGGSFDPDRTGIELARMEETVIDSYTKDHSNSYRGRTICRSSPENR